MADLLKNPLAYLGTSFALFLVALPLISVGSTGGPSALLWVGLAALVIGGIIPPVQRLVCGSTSESESDEKAED